MINDLMILILYVCLIDGSLYLCLPSTPLPPAQPLSFNCSSVFSHPNSGPYCQISYILGPSLLKISYSMLVPGDLIDLSSMISPSSSTPSSYLVPPAPPSLNPFLISISGPSHIFAPGGRVCWLIRAIGEGGRGVQYQVVQSNDSRLLDDLSWELVQWEGSDEGIVCLEGDEWSQLGNGDYEFVVEATSVLFGTATDASYSFSISHSDSGGELSRSVGLLYSDVISRQQQQNDECNPDLWNNSVSSIYGIQTFPSGQTLLPPTLRSTPLIITTKALSPCVEVGMSKNILPPSNLTWSFLPPISSGLVGVDIESWIDGTKLAIPVSYLENREAFPMNEAVGISVVADFGEGIVFSAETFVQFVGAGVDVITNPVDMPSILGAEDTLVIDLTDSLTGDGLIVGEVGYFK